MALKLYEVIAKAGGPEDLEDQVVFLPLGK